MTTWIDVSTQLPELHAGVPLKRSRLVWIKFHGHEMLGNLTQITDEEPLFVNESNFIVYGVTHWADL